MSDEVSRYCVECQGTMSPVVIIDKTEAGHRHARELEYRQPDDKQSFWTGKFPSAGKVWAWMCGGCGRIALYGSAAAAEPDGGVS